MRVCCSNLLVFYNVQKEVNPANGESSNLSDTSDNFYKDHLKKNSSFGSGCGICDSHQHTVHFFSVYYPFSYATAILLWFGDLLGLPAWNTFACDACLKRWEQRCCWAPRKNASLSYGSRGGYSISTTCLSFRGCFNLRFVLFYPAPRFFVKLPNIFPAVRLEPTFFSHTGLNIACSRRVLNQDFTEAAE